MPSLISVHVAPPSRLARRETPPTITWLLVFGFTPSTASYHPWPLSSSGVDETSVKFAPPFELRYSVPPLSSTSAYTVSGCAFANAISTRPDETGRPVAPCHVTPPSHEYIATPYPPVIAFCASDGLKSTSCGVMPVLMKLKVEPALTLRHRPVCVAASSVPPAGATAIRFTAVDWRALPASCVHVVPPSTLLKIPAPRMASELP